MGTGNSGELSCSLMMLGLKKSVSTWLGISNSKLKGGFCTGGARRWHKDKSLACLMTCQAEHCDLGGICGAKFQPEAHAKALL